MKRSTSRWTTAIAAAALLGVPAATFAQTPAQTPSSQTTTSSQPPTSTQTPSSTAQPPSSTTGTPSTTPATEPAEPSAQNPSAQPPATQVDAAAAKQALSEARDTLAQLASMPEAAKLQGDQRTQVSQLISNFNELITTQSNWKDAYGKVENSLNALIGPETGATAEPGASPSMAGTAGTTGAGSPAATGTSGSTAAPASGSAEAPAASATSIDPAIRAKLVEFRTHLKAFEQAAGGEATTSSPASSSMASSTEPTPASTAASSASNPTTTPETSMTSQSAQPATQTAAAGQTAVGTSGTTAPTATDARTLESQTQANRQLDAIQAILAQAKNGRLNQAQIDQLKTHVTELRQLLGGSK